MMEPSLKKQKGDEEGVVRDRLSEMPDEIILHILSFLSTLDAVKTMLIRRFGNLWTLLPSLSFDCGKFNNDRYTDDLKPAMDKVLLSFARFVSNTLLMLHRRATIEDFWLDIEEFGYSMDPNTVEDAKMWLRFAVEREAKDIFFSVQGYDEFIPPPRCVFASKHLVKLELRGCKIEPQHQLFIGSLRKLSLFDCFVSNEAFNQLISGCPSLQELDLEYIQELQDIRITTPSVTKLILQVLWKSYKLDCPSLKILEIQECYTLVDVIDVSSLQKVIMRDLPRQCTSSAKCFEILYQLVKSSTHLEELVVYNTECNLLHDTCNVVFLEPSSPRVMPRLKTVTSYGYRKGGERQLQVAEFFLKNAVILEKLIIVLGKNQLEAAEELKFVKQVSTFRRASTNASVIFA